MRTNHHHQGALTLLQGERGTRRRHYLFVVRTESRHQTRQHWTRRQRANCPRIRFNQPGAVAGHYSRFFFCLSQQYFSSYHPPHTESPPTGRRSHRTADLFLLLFQFEIPHCEFKSLSFILHTHRPKILSLSLARQVGKVLDGFSRFSSSESARGTSDLDKICYKNDSLPFKAYNSVRDASLKHGRAAHNYTAADLFIPTATPFK